MGQGFGNIYEDIDTDRRRFLSMAAMTVAGARLGANGAAATQSARTKAFAEPKQVDAGVLNIGYVEVGPGAGPPVVLLHGWPYGIHDNPDDVSLVIHYYRWRLGLAEGESKYDQLETQLAAGPIITVPTITLEGDANGAPHPDPTAYAKKFSGKYAHRLLTGGIGHNPPHEAPQTFADAIVEVDRF